MSRPEPEVCRVLVLGSTGSIGTQTLEVIGHLNALHAHGKHPRRFAVVGLVCGRNEKLLREQAMRFHVPHTGSVGELSEWNNDASEITYERRAVGAGSHYAGPDAALGMVEDLECDLVVSAIVGSAGIRATLAAVQRGRDVALANKETLVAAGSLIINAAKASGSRLLPVDSEHSGLWQALLSHSQVDPPIALGPEVTRAIITASGGPFRTWTREQLERATPEQALNHPIWRMGRKVTIDSASLMNKALEVIEAHWLFGLDVDRLGVLIHPQSMVHAMVEFADGSTIAHLGAPDMRGPIQYALTHPDRPGCPQRRIDWAELRSLTFEEPDAARFPALGLAYKAIRAGGAAGAILNAANEEAVGAFLGSSGEGRPPAIPFTHIPMLTEAAMEALGAPPIASLADVLEADRAARRFVRGRLESMKERPTSAR